MQADKANEKPLPDRVKAWDDAAILRHVDHTLLKATASWPEIRTLCEEAVCFRTASVCVPPCYVRRVREAFQSLTLCTVIGFPLGYGDSAVKAEEARIAIQNGADELDMVINITDVKNGAFDLVRAEIAAMKEIAGPRILKVIVETCYLTREEKIALCHAVTGAGADYIKTSTGFGTAGACLADIELFILNIGKNVRIKGSGGIRTREDMIRYLEAGCARLGTSSAVAILGDAAGKL